MTEQEWLACTDPTPMLEFVRDKASDRKMRLFACICCRRIWHLLPQECKNAVEMSERLAEGLVTEEDLLSALVALPQPGGLGEKLPSQSAVWWACRPSHSYPGKFKAEPAKGTVRCVVPAIILGNRPLTSGELRNRTFRIACAGHEKSLCNVVRDFFGNPFRPMALDPGWLTPKVVALARTIYDERTFDRLSVLADALEEAGCTDADLLTHCRQPGEHVRGCWVVDLLLGRE